MRKLTIVIPTIGKKHIIECLTNIFEHTLPEEEFDLIIVKNDRRGYTVPVNRAMRLSDPESDILLMGDDNVVVEPFIEKFQKEVKPGVGLISHEKYGYGTGKTPDLWRSSFGMVYIPRETIDRVGLLDENFVLYCQDLDYCYRVENVCGLKQVKIDIKVRHDGNKTLGDINLFPESGSVQKKENQMLIEKWDL